MCVPASGGSNGSFQTVPQMAALVFGWDRPLFHLLGMAFGGKKGSLLRRYLGKPIIAFESVGVGCWVIE